MRLVKAGWFLKALNPSIKKKKKISFFSFNCIELCQYSIWVREPIRKNTKVGRGVYLATLCPSSTAKSPWSSGWCETCSSCNLVSWQKKKISSRCINIQKGIYGEGATYSSITFHNSLVNDFAHVSHITHTHSPTPSLSEQSISNWQRHNPSAPCLCTLPWHNVDIGAVCHVSVYRCARQRHSLLWNRTRLSLFSGRWGRV